MWYFGCLLFAIMAELSILTVVLVDLVMRGHCFMAFVFAVAAWVFLAVTMPLCDYLLQLGT